MAPFLSDRTFQVWEYQVSHGQLLIRSASIPEETESGTRENIDLLCYGVEYMALPTILAGVELGAATAEEISYLEQLLGGAVAPTRVRILISRGRRYPVVAAAFYLSRNDWDCFDSPFEFQCRFHGALPEGKVRL